jgi:heterodisulfide reductase subunit C
MATASKVIKREEVDPDFSKIVEKLADTDIYACYQCGVCSGGCPINFMMDYTPRQILRMAQSGIKDKVLSSTTIWLCSSCNTCFTRCPREIELPEVMASLKSLAIKEGIDAKIKEGPALYRSMVENMKRYGRIHETGLYIDFARKTGLSKLTKQMSSGLTLFRKGKIKLRPEKIKSLEQLKAMIKKIEQMEKEEET